MTRVYMYIGKRRGGKWEGKRRKDKKMKRKLKSEGAKNYAEMVREE
jgi:hypothetical protein